jgi:hypothetical protein
VVAYIDRADGSDTPLYTSPQLEGLLGYTQKEGSGVRLWRERLHPQDRERVLATPPNQSGGCRCVPSSSWRRRNASPPRRSLSPGPGCPLRPVGPAVEGEPPREPLGDVPLSVFVRFPPGAAGSTTGRSVETTRRVPDATMAPNHPRRYASGSRVETSAPVRDPVRGDGGVGLVPDAAPGRPERSGRRGGASTNARAADTVEEEAGKTARGGAGGLHAASLGGAGPPASPGSASRTG